MTQEKENPKTKMKIFDYIFESSIKSSRTIIGIVNEIITLADDATSLRLSIINLSNVLQHHQQILDDISKLIEQIAKDKKNVTTNPFVPDTKKDKPN